jgi:aminopeptidase N
VSKDGGSSVWCIEAPAVRELGLVMSRSLTNASRTTGGVLVQAFAESKAQAKRLLAAAAHALDAYGERYGSYPWPVYTVCAVPLGVDGAEYTALAMVNRKLEGTRQEYAVAHETAHQWWYALVGSDSQTHPWLDEALCEYSLLEYVESRYGRAAREELRQSRIEPSMRITVAGQATPGAPLDYFETASDYQMLVYGRAAAFLCAADELLGGRLDDVLSRWAEQYAFAIADRDAFVRLVPQVSGVDIEPLMVDYLDTYLIN